MERNVSAMISRRAPASATISSGPLVATQASFICGRAEILDTPLSVKVSGYKSGTLQYIRTGSTISVTGTYGGKRVNLH